MKRRLELASLISLNSFDLKRQARGGVVIELDGSFHVTVRIEPKYAQPSAIIDSSELVELLAPATASQSIHELNVYLDLMTRQLLLIALPFFVMAFIALGGGKAIEVESFEDSPDTRAADGDIVVAG